MVVLFKVFTITLSDIQCYCIDVILGIPIAIKPQEHVYCTAPCRDK